MARAITCTRSRVIRAIFSLGLACLPVLGGIAIAHTETPSSPCDAQVKTPPSLERFLETNSFGEKDGRRIALVDLDGRGPPEALVYLRGMDWCGSGGCTLLVLRERNGSWMRVSRITATRLPVRVLDRRRHGWHSLQVHVGGGGIASADVVLDFDGRRYPGNPTVVARTSTDAGAGRTLIDVDGSTRCPR